MGSWTDWGEPIYLGLVRAHVAIGCVALILFWVGALSRKGSRFHVRSGKLFVSCVYAVAASALIVVAYRLVVPLSPEQLNAESSTDRLEDLAAVNQSMRLFLAYLALIALIHARHGVRIIRTRQDPLAIDTPVDRGLVYGLMAGAVGMMTLGLLAGPWLRVLFLLFSPLGFVIAWDILSYLRDPVRSPRSWWYAHMDAMIGCGITLHTAFAIVGVGRLFNVTLSEAWLLLPLLPAAVGTVALKLWKRHYRIKFGELLPRVRPDPVPLVMMPSGSTDSAAINTNDLPGDKGGGR